MQVSRFEYDDVRAADELYRTDFDAVDPPFFRLDLQTTEVDGRARRNVEIELSAYRFGPVVEHAESLYVPAVPGDGVIDDLAVVASSKRFSYREHVYSFEESTLAVSVRAGKDD